MRGLRSEWPGIAARQRSQASRNSPEPRALAYASAIFPCWRRQSIASHVTAPLRSGVSTSHRILRNCGWGFIGYGVVVDVQGHKRAWCRTSPRRR